MSTRSPNDYEVPNMDDFLGSGPNREQRSAEMHASLMEFLTESDSMRTTAKNSLKQSLYAGGGAFAGSFIGGPVGGLVGGIAGSLVGFFKSDDYDGLLLAVSKIDDAHRTKLLKVSRNERGYCVVWSGYFLKVYNGRFNYFCLKKLRSLSFDAFFDTLLFILRNLLMAYFEFTLFPDYASETCYCSSNRRWQQY